MEPDRYDKNHAMYIVSMLSFLISLSLFLFSLFMLPHLLFGWHYDVPEFISFWREWLYAHYAISRTHSSWYIFLFFIFFVALFAMIAHVTTDTIDNEVCDIHSPQTLKSPIFSRGMTNSLRFFLKILVIVLFFYGLILGFEWILTGKIEWIWTGKIGR